MKTFLSMLAVALAFTFTAAPADAAQTLLQKCRSSVAKVEMDYAKCVKKGVVVEEKGKAADWDRCAQKRSVGFLKTQAIYVARQGVDSEACGLDETSLSVSKALMLVASGEDPANHGISAEVFVGTPLDGTSDNAAVAEATCGEAGGTWVNEACKAPNGCDDDGDGITICEEAGGTCENGACTAADITSDNAAIAAAAEQDGCEAANGTWDASVCTPAAVADRDCFREGACGVDGYNLGDYQGGTVSSTGCADTAAGSDSYVDGTSTYTLLHYYFSTFPAPLCVPN